MEVTINNCTKESLQKVLSLVDNEFIFNKKRAVSMATRYPTLFQKSNWENIYVACFGEDLLATTTVRNFALLSNGRMWKGAMIGLVCTAPDARGRGLASLVMKAIVQEHKNLDMDFFVLWTNINGFYERLGWVTEDEGAFGKVNLGSLCCNVKMCIPLTYADVNIGWIEKMRAKYLQYCVLRSADDYAIIPPSVDVVDFFTYEGAGAEGYAIVGRKERKGIIYEMVGSPEAFPVLFHSIGQHVDSLFINDRPASASGVWLTEKRCVKWQPQNQAMWYKLSRDFVEVSCKKLYIPYFDRI